MDELTQRLSIEQPVEVGGPRRTLEEFRERLEDIGVVFIKFTGTQGGTDLGLRLDREATDTTAADLAAGTGTVHVEGTLVLNDDPVRCVAEIDVATLAGTGRLVVVPESELVA
jgi:hypothetical protein